MTALGEDRLRILIEVGRAVVSELDLEVLLRRVLHTARELTHARYAALGILDERRDGLERFVALGVDGDAREAIGELPRGKGVLGTLISEPRALRLDDVGAHPSSYGFPPGHPRMRTFLGVPILVGGEAWGNLYLADKAGGAAFDEADEESVAVLAGWAAIAIANARLYARAEGRRSELERAVRGLEATQSVHSALGGETELERVLELVAKRGRALVDARALAVLVAESDGLRVAALAGTLDTGARGAVLSHSSLPGQLLSFRRTERVGDVATRLRHGLEPLGVSGPALFVPLVFRGEALGVLCAFERALRGPRFDADDERLLGAFAAAAAQAVATARSFERGRLRERIEAQEAERRRFARELHDETLQGLGGLMMLLHGALGTRSPDRVEQAVREAVSFLETEIESLRAIIGDLRPASLDQIGLDAALRALARRVGDTTSLAVDIEVDLALEGGRADSRLDPEVESTVYRLVQEGLANAARHSGAPHARLSVVERDGAIEVSIADDGRGFDPGAPRAGYGLSGMEERVALAGGILEVSSHPGRGTRLGATIPARREPRTRSALP